MWSNYFFNFDNMIYTIITLFKMASAYGWQEVMYKSTASRGIDLEPIADYRSYWQLFFIFFTIYAAFFLFNLFVGIVINKFLSYNDTENGLNLLSEHQKDWVDI